jgi:hypothetical protein
MAKTERERWMDPKTWLWVLGINAWGALLAVPAWHLKLWGKSSLWAPLLLPLLVLALSITRAHQVGLLFLFPAALLLPAAIVPRLTGVNVYITATFLITVLSLSAYLLGAAAATRDGGVAPRSVEVRALNTKEIPARWRRRLRLIMVFAVLTVIVPTMLLTLSDGTPGGGLIAEEPLQPMIVNAVAFLLGLGIVLVYFMAPLISFLRNEEPPFLGVARHPLLTIGFWVALLSGGAAVYFLFTGEA